MNISLNLSSPTNLTVDNTTTVQQTPNTPNTGLTVSITTGANGNNGVQPTAITLTFPTIGPEDISLNEVLQDLKNLNLDVMKGMSLTSAVLALNSTIGDVARAMVKGGPEWVKANAETLNNFFSSVEEQSKQAETQLFDLINNSSYPDFNSFLSKMLLAAQELRELASKAKHELVKAEFDNVIDQAKQMEITAKKTYDSTIKEIEAAEKEAIGKIISGCVSIISIGVVGAKFGLAQGGQLGGQIGDALGKIIEGGVGLAAGADRREGAAFKLEADLADAIRKKMEATQKLLQEAQGITDELKDIAKTLADMVLKLYQDFISNQSQIIQRANV